MASETLRRLEVPSMDEIIGKTYPVLDHGFIRVVDYMGGDSAIVQAARVSYGKGTKKTSQDRGLIRYLMKHRHTTPFEMCELKVHVKLPIFVARQWIRHRTASVNEYSARYSIMDKEFYVPEKEFIAQQSEINKQGRGGVLDKNEAVASIEEIEKSSSNAYNIYENLMNENINGEQINSDKNGIARELARMVLPTNYYTQWYWKINLHNLFHFIALRENSHAQYEIRVYAEILNDIVKQWVPFAWEAFEDYRHKGVSFSHHEFELIKAVIHQKEISEIEKALSDRELSELMDKLGLSRKNI